MYCLWLTFLLMTEKSLRACCSWFETWWLDKVASLLVWNVWKIVILLWSGCLYLEQWVISLRIIFDLFLWLLFQLDGKKIGIRPSVEQDTLFIGNLNKGFSHLSCKSCCRRVIVYLKSVFPWYWRSSIMTISS